MSTTTDIVPMEIRARGNGSVLFRAEIAASVPQAARLRVALETAVRARAGLRGADLTDAGLRGAILHGAGLRDADLRGAALTDAGLRGADLTDAGLRGADLRGADLTDADLRGADLRGADLTDADLRGAILHGANLRDAILHGADLSRADLSDAILRGADLSRADLSDAILRGADLSRAAGLPIERTSPLALLRWQPGPIRLFKVLTANDEGHINGGLRYPMGEAVEVADADTDPHALCGRGIHVASLDWCLRGWREGLMIAVMEFHAKDIACIPLGTDGKLRLFRCTRVADIPDAEVRRMLGLAAERGEARGGGDGG